MRPTGITIGVSGTTSYRHLFAGQVTVALYWMLKNTLGQSAGVRVPHFPGKSQKKYVPGGKSFPREAGKREFPLPGFPREMCEREFPNFCGPGSGKKGNGKREVKGSAKKIFKKKK